MFDKRNTVKELQRGFKIPPRPDILKEIDEMSSNPEFALTDLAGPIAKDAGISSAVLQVVNSSLFGLNRTIVDIPQAVCILRLEQIKAIISIYKLRQEYTDYAIDLNRFWSETNTVAETMLYINKWLGNSLQPDTLFSLGLFSNCGIAAMAFKFEGYMDTLQLVYDDPSLDLYVLEDETYSTDHATVGYFIASSWHFPKPICKMIRFSHDIEIIQSKFPADVQASMAALFIAENLVRQIRHFETTDWFVEHKDCILPWLQMTNDDYEELKDDIESRIN